MLAGTGTNTIVGLGATIENRRRWILVPGYVIMWSNREQHVFANDKNRKTFYADRAAGFRVQIHAYVLWHTDAWHAAPDTTTTLEEY